MHKSAPMVRCAIYTRKSTEEGLDQDFNSLHGRNFCRFKITELNHVFEFVRYDKLRQGALERPDAR